MVTSTKVQVASGGIYLSDISWVKATAGWATVQKDKSTDKNPISLLGTTGPITYKKESERIRSQKLRTTYQMQLTNDFIHT